MIKKLALMCLILVPTFLLLAACAGGGSTVTQPPTSTPSSTATSVPTVTQTPTSTPSSTATPAPTPTPPPDRRDLPVDVTAVLRSGPTLSNISAHSATLSVGTTINLICAIAYGPTTNYGQIATDMDMAAGGHSDHHPLLRGLQPDTEYHYRLGGMGPDGTIYRSADFTFRTPPESEGLLQKPIGGKLPASIRAVSSNFGGGANNSAFGANNAIDGNPDTQWSSDGEGNGAWIELDLSAENFVTSLGFWTRTMGTSAEIHSFSVVTDRGETYGPFQVNDAGSMYYFEVDFTAQRVRFEVVDSSGGNTGVIEIAIYGEAVMK